MLLGVLVTITWEQLDKPYGLNSVLISLPVALIALFVVSLAAPDRTDAARPLAEEVA